MEPKQHLGSRCRLDLFTVAFTRGFVLLLLLTLSPVAIVQSARATSAVTPETLFLFPTNGAIRSPNSGLIERGDGTLLGTTALDENGVGRVFAIDTNLSLLGEIYASTNLTEISKGTDSSVYTTGIGGSNGYVVIRLNPNGASSAISVSPNFPLDGLNGGLIQDASGNLFGTASGGGANGAGTIYRFAPNAPVVVTNFVNSGIWRTNVAINQISPAASPSFGTYATAFSNSPPSGYSYLESPGVFVYLTATNYTLPCFSSPLGTNFYYGLLTNLSRGTYCGSGFFQTNYSYAHIARKVFQPEYKTMTFVWPLQAVHHFNGEDGRSPNGSLIFGSDGHLYGTTSSGGSHDFGTVFKVSTNGSFTLLHAFTGSEGATPHEGLVVTSDGNFYGVTTAGGEFGAGTIFKMTSNGVVTALHSFHPISPESGTVSSRLIEGVGGWFYGTLESGGEHSVGAIYRIKKTGEFRLLHSFQQDENGWAPRGPLLRRSDGHFYGTTSEALNGSGGSLFRFTDIVHSPENGAIGYALYATDSCDLNNSRIESFDSSDLGYARDTASVFGFSSASLYNTKVYGFIPWGGYLNNGSSVGDKMWVDSGNIGVQPGHAPNMFRGEIPDYPPPPSSNLIPAQNVYVVETNVSQSGVTVTTNFYSYVFGTGVYVTSLADANTLIVGNAVIHATNSFIFSGNRRMRIRPNASLTLYGDGASASIGRIENLGGNPLKFQYIGSPQNQNLSVSTLYGPFIGCIYAPNAEVRAVRGGAEVEIFGNIVARRIYFDGVNFAFDDGLYEVIPQIKQQPIGFEGVAGQTVCLTATISGNECVYRWFRNGIRVAPTSTTFDPLTERYTVSLCLTNAQASQSGNYTLVANNRFGQATTVSASVVITNEPLPLIVAHPTSQIVKLGSNIVLSAEVVGTPPLTYQWRFGTNVIENASSSNLVITNATLSHAGSYSVVVSNVGGTAISSQAVVAVSSDFSGPTLKIAFPMTGQRLEDGMNVTNDLTTMRGTVSDSSGVANLMFKLNDGDWTFATGTTNWSAALTLRPGQNTVVVKAIDGVENENALTRTFSYLVKSRLTLQLIGMGQVTPNLGGTNLDIGKVYRMTASTGFSTNWIFTNWTCVTATGTNVFSTSNVLDFVMVSNLVLQANYIPNPFLLAAGNYTGLFYETNAVSHHSSGFIQAQVTRNLGFSGKLFLDGDTVSISGKFSVDGTATKTFSREQLGKPGITLNLALDFANWANQMSGSVQGSNWTASLVSDRYVWSTNVGGKALQFTNKYTLAIPGFTNAANGPIGFGHGYGSVNELGKVSVFGSLSDGRAINRRTAISRLGQWPLYVPLYPEQRITPFRTGLKTNIVYQGALLGWIRIGSNAPVAEPFTPEGTTSWIKTSWTNQLYGAGFTNTAPLLGSIYQTPPKGSRILTLTNASVGVTGGYLIGAFTNSVVLSSNNIVTVTPPVTNRLKISLTTVTGLLQGNFTNSTGTTRFQGVILQDYNFGRGWFINGNEAGSVTLDPQ